MPSSLPTEQRAKIQLRPISAQLPGGANVVKPVPEARHPRYEPVLRLPEKRASKQVEREPFRTGTEGWVKASEEASSPPPPPVAKPGAFGRSRRSRQRQRARRRWFWAVGLMLAASAFAAGYKWSSKKTVEDMAEMNLEVLAMAVRSMDDAVRAMYAGKYKDAQLMAADARRAHPEISGSYLLEGEALMSDPTHKAEDRQILVEMALGEGSYAGRARLLQAEHLRRAGLEGEQPKQVSAETVMEQLRQGMREDMGSFEPRMKAAELQARLPRSPLAQESYLEALHRLQEWQSAAVISAKMQVAGDEVGRKLVLPNKEEFLIPRSSAGSALAALRRAVRAGADPVEALQELQKFLPESSYAKLLHDPSLSVSVPPPSLMAARRSTTSALPHFAAKGPEPLE